MEILTLKELLSRVLSIINKEQNAHYPHDIYSSHVRIALDVVLDECARLYPTSYSLVDKLRPFIKYSPALVNDGVLSIPKDARNILGGWVVSNDDSSNCNCDEDSLIEYCDEDSPLYFGESQTIKGCKVHKLKILSSDEYSMASNSYIKPPTIKNPIAMVVDGSIMNVCPNSVGSIIIMYIKYPKKYELGVKLMPDDTWQVDDTKPYHVESEFTTNISSEMVKIITTLYGIYTRDGDITNWVNEIKKLGWF